LVLYQRVALYASNMQGLSNTVAILVQQGCSLIEVGDSSSDRTNIADESIRRFLAAQVSILNLLCL